MAKFSFDARALLHRTEFHLAGTHCFFSTNSQDLLRAMPRWRAITLPSNAQSFEMEILVDSAVCFRGQHSVHFRGLRHLVFGLLPPYGFAVFDLLRRRVQGVITPASAGDSTFWNSILLPISVGVLGTTMGVAPLHCACLDSGGSAVLVAGRSGAGKSTLAAALAQCGFALVSDDWTYLSRNSSSLVAQGLLAPVKLLPDVVRFFPRLNDFTPIRTLNGEMAYEVDPRVFAGASVKRASHPRWIFFLERTNDSGCHFIPCRPEFVRQFFEHSAEKLPCELRDAQLIRSSLINDLSVCPSWIIRSSENPLKTADALSRFISEVHHARD